VLLASLRSGLAVAGGTLQGKRLTVIDLKVKLGQDPLAIGYFADIVQRNNDLWLVHHPPVSLLASGHRVERGPRSMARAHESEGFFVEFNPAWSGKTATNSGPNRYNAPPDLIVFDIG
jgi:hypothetical protein